MKARIIGRRVLLKYVILLTVGLFLLFSSLVWLTDPLITVSGIATTWIYEAIDNLGFIGIQVLIILGGIWLMGGICGQLIIEKGKNEVLVGVGACLSLWTLSFLSTAIITGLEKSILLGTQEFLSAFSSRIIFGLIPFLVTGIASGPVIGYFLGRELKVKAIQLNALQENI